MSDLQPHTEWMSLIDISGPFLAEPVLKDAFPQGLEDLEPHRRRSIRQAYDEWREALDLDDPDLSKIHQAWIDFVLRQALELDEDGKGDVFKGQADLPDSIRHDVDEFGVSLRPDYAVVDDQRADKPLMLVCKYGPDTPLDKPLKGDGWAASPAERMVDLCRAADVRLGLVTNGEQWMFIDAPIGGVTTFASWYARLWGQEPATLQAFVNLLGVRRFFVDSGEQLPALLDESVKHQDEVTDALGEQVRRAVEVLIQALDRADVDRNRTLLANVEPAELYEAGLTVMMRIVFLLSAEERGLMLLGDERYEANYSVSTLRMQLRGEPEEILERRFDAWSRLLSIFRVVYGGVEHEAMRLPALGGSLFDPDRFPFLEGRAEGTNWKSDPAAPLPIDNRTVLLLLDAVQLFQGRALSYRALDIEQIGYVYEGLLERTVVRAEEVTLDLDATKSAKRPWVTIDELDDAKAKGDDAVLELLRERTGSSASRVRNDYAKKVDEADADKLLTACHGDQALRDRIKPYFHLLRMDSWGYPLVYPEGTFTVTFGTDRSESGTHYTPKSLTEAIVRETLEPVIYDGPGEGKPREEWRLRAPDVLLDLKICDPAMGSGAFLVQVCRWLSERLVEAWRQAEAAGNAVTAEGAVVAKRNGHEPLRDDPEERLLTARRLIAERCLYGVDVNPLAVELAKLSVWLVTLAKGRPFGFLDHNFRTGDSLLGVHALDQLLYLDMKPDKGSSKKLFAKEIDKAIEAAIEVRAGIRARPIRDIRDVQAMAAMDEEARAKLELPGLIADALIGEVLTADGKNPNTAALSVEAGNAIAGEANAITALKRRARIGLEKDLADGKPVRRPFHWPLEFPEVFSGLRGGFDAVVGNPPFLGSQRLSGIFGPSYKDYLANNLTLDGAATADLVAFFFLRAFRIIRREGNFGFLARRSLAEGKNREICLEALLAHSASIFAANTNIIWPGKASVVVHQVHVSRSPWGGAFRLNGVQISSINSYLDELAIESPRPLAENAGQMFQGIILNGEGFKIGSDEADQIKSLDLKYDKVILPFIGGNEVNKDPNYRPACYVISFWDWPEEEAKKFEQAYEIVETYVKPERQRKKDNGDFKLRNPLPQKWWQYGEKRPALFHAVGRGSLFRSHPADWREDQERLKRVIVISRGVTKYPSFTFLSNDFAFSEKLYVLADSRYSVFSVLSSDIHAVWAWFQKTSMGADLHSLSYTSGDIFETFPFPDKVLSDDAAELTALGEKFFEARRDYMVATDKGMTKFYNDFHDPGCNDAAIVACRDLQKQIDEAVLATYGFDDIDLDIGFHQVAYLPAGKNTRYTMSEDARQKVLSRLALLNKERHEAESKKGGAGKHGASMKASNTDMRDDLFAAGGGGP
ncbi:DNA methyltransferase [Labrenzia sp. R5_0]|uniref:Eco57I restriction-modification methylase domain-containing protein n=1 Tax=Labrenzia sp. R5_0 TaxID=2821108 RepID=UPI001ADD39B0|nr:DNA methyltransferase [Labrenzia sp. R5_0]MBO9460681.1 hypothetical protein [Labrenzia sp. R5_0]